MFSIKKVTKAGQCAAMRCIAPCADLLCPRHEQEWRDAGMPALTTQTDQAPAKAGKEAESGALVLSVPASLQTELTTARHEAQESLALIAELSTDTEEDRALCSELMKMAAGKVKDLDAQRLTVTKPLNEIVKTVNSWFKPAIEFYGQAKELLGDKLAAALVQQETARKEALALIQENAGDAPAEVFDVAHAPVDAPNGAQVRRTLKYRVTDIKALPDYLKYEVPDAHKIELLVKAEGLKLTIPGLEVYEEVSVGVGR